VVLQFQTCNIAEAEVRLVLPGRVQEAPAILPMAGTTTVTLIQIRVLFPQELLVTTR
jgi:hypothetical protein